MSTLSTPLVSMKRITKSFPGVLADDDVDLDLYAGEIQVILGENGAGKSVLMNILYGLYHQDSGEILVEGIPAKITNCLDAQARGIGMVHQSFALIPDFTVLENFAIGIRGTGVRLNLSEIEANVEKAAKQYNLDVPTRRKVRELSMGERQRVELLKLLFRNARVLILDEPTSVLTPQESANLFVSLDALKGEGKAIALITHKLYEVLQVADRVTVLRRGKVVFKSVREGLTAQTLTEAMIGRSVTTTANIERYTVEPKGSLQATDVTVLNDEKQVAVVGASLRLAEGRILGVAGVAGNGQKELIEALAGLRGVSSGMILLNAKEISKTNLRERVNLGIRYIPEDKRSRGVAVSLALTYNAVLHDHWRSPFATGEALNLNEVRNYAKQVIAKFSVKAPSETVQAGSLSGGNLQKFIVGREALRDPAYILAENPTAGLDVAATEFVRKLLMEYRNQGKGILLVSEDLDELLELSDEITVMYRGRTSISVQRRDFDKLKIGAMCLGQGFVAESAQTESTIARQ